MAERSGIGGVGSLTMRRSTIVCPHCRANMIIRGSEQETDLVKRLRVMCTNEDCGLTGVAQISWVYQLCPSQIPNPDVVIPPAPPEYVRKHFRHSQGPPIDPDQLLMFDDIGAAHG